MTLRLTRSIFKVLSNICADIAQVFFGAVVAGLTVLSLEAGSVIVLILHSGFALGFWYLSLFFGERGKL